MFGVSTLRPIGARACPSCGSRDGSWVARYSAPGWVGTVQVFDRRADAERWLTGQEASKLTGGWVDPALGRMTFEEWVDALG